VEKGRRTTGFAKIGPGKESASRCFKGTGALREKERDGGVVPTQNKEKREKGASESPLP